MENKKTVFITGASRGIGLETAKALRKSGDFNLLLCGSKIETVNNLEKYFSNDENTLLIKCDVTNQSDIDAAVSAAIEKFGSIDVLFNNAGIFSSSSLLKTSDEMFDSIIDINLKGPFRIIKAALPYMQKNNSGVILNTNSVVASKAFYGCSAYAASKAGFLSMANTLREEVRKFGIKVINISPGATATEIWTPENLEKFGERMMQPEDLGSLVKDIILNALSTSICIEDIVLRPVGGDL